jgi:hypothetical protein
MSSVDDETSFRQVSSVIKEWCGGKGTRLDSRDGDLSYRLGLGIQRGRERMSP